jgi:hypothetical protein
MESEFQQEPTEIMESHRMKARVWVVLPRRSNYLHPQKKHYEKCIEKSFLDDPGFLPFLGSFSKCHD